MYDYEYVGLFKSIYGGIQIDLNSVLHNKKEASLCNHNCTSEYGSYTCPAAFTLNKGIKPNYTSADILLEWLHYGIEGLKQNRDLLLNSSLLKAHANKFNWPDKMLNAYINTVLFSDVVEINLFGGNPEIYPELNYLLKELKKKSVTVNLTTTGRVFLKDTNYLETLPDFLALSLDDITCSELNHLIELGPDEIKNRWKKINPLHGQKQKAYEALYTLFKLDIPVIINLPLHIKNLSELPGIIEIFKRQFPKALINPYPTQTRFYYEKGDTDLADVFESTIDWMIEKHFEDSNIVKRLHYWLGLKAIYKQPEDSRPNLLSGEAWHCAKTYTGYVQIGRGSGESSVPGGKLGCFWNTDTVNKSSVLNSSDEVFQYLIETRYNLYSKSKNKCPGCLMPRLVGDVLSLEQGLHPLLINDYLNINKDILSFS